MSINVSVREAESHLSDLLDQTTCRGERIVIERQGKPIGALVSMEDLRRLESAPQERAAVSPEQHEADTEEAKQARFRRALEEKGLVLRWPEGPPSPVSEDQLLEVEGPPVSEQIIAERR